jgi:putative ABC transport system permease protein
MLKSYFRIILRNLSRNKLYLVVNILGLAAGIAALVWGFQNYRYCLSYDDFHKDRNDIFRVLSKAAGNDNLRGVCPGPMADFTKAEFPIVKEAVRWDSRNLDVKAAQSEPFETVAHFTSPAFFDLFNFPLLAGTNRLNDPTTVLVTDQAAKKFFGDADPIGKTLLFYSGEQFSKPLTVTGVLKNPPSNSSLQFELITSTENLLWPDGSVVKSDDWSWFSDAVFFRLSNSAAEAGLPRGMEKYLPLEQAARRDVKLVGFTMEPISKVANMRGIQNNKLIARPTDSAVYGPLVLSILILLSASLNFANTSVAQSSRRLKEMGVRKVLGSSHKQIMLQQLLECAFIVLMATALSVVINIVWLPTYNAMFTHVEVGAHYFSDRTLLAFIGATLTGVTLLAGAYPAFYISKFNASNIFSGSVRFGGANLFSRVMLGLQIVISFITIIAGVAFYRNSEFQRTYDYGYEKENVVGVYLQNENAYKAVRDQLNSIPDIDMVGGTVNNIGFSYRRITLEAKGEKKESIYLEAGENYVEVMKLRLVAGRAFDATTKGDENSVLVNEKLAFQLGWKPGEAVGQQVVVNDTTAYTVIGVLKDFEQGSFFDPIQPVLVKMVPPESYSQMIIHAKTGSLVSVYNQTKAVWEKIFPLKPFRGYYQDEIAAEASRVNESIATIFYWFAIISVLMTTTGMFALVSLTVLKRMKEIAVRRVVGAKDWNIYRLVANGYFWIFILAAGIGCYFGYSLSRLLMNQIFRVNAGISVWSLVVAFLGNLLISAITVGSRVWRVLNTKAADVLRDN